jgi:hypothetical protein
MSYTPLVNTILTGDPRVPTASFPDSDTSVASTGFVSTNFTTLATSQTISGAKTLSADLTLTDSQVLFNDMTAATTVIWDADVTGDTNKRISVDAAGKMSWGGGSGAADATLERSAANILTIGADDYLRLPTTPATATDAVNKAYVDSLAYGLDWKASVRAATTANITLANEQTIDGVSVIAGDRVLVKDQTAGEDNGIYVVVDGGSWTRSTDADADAEVTSGCAMFVTEGTANGDKGFVLTTNDPITLNTTSLTFTQFSSTTLVDTLDELTDVSTSGQTTGSLLRNSDGTNWSPTTALLYSAAGQLQNSTDGSSGGILLGGDAQWYRGGTDIMRTPDALVVDLTSTLTGVVTATAGVTSPVGYTATSTGTVSTNSGNISSASGNLVITAGTATVGGTSTLTGLVTATAGVTSPAGYTATSTGTVTTNSGNISSTSGNIVTSSGNIEATAGTLTVGSTAIMSGGIRTAPDTKTANYSVSPTADYVILADSSGGGFTITLPASHTSGERYVIKDSGGAAATNNIVIDPSDADTVDGSSTFTLDVNYQSVEVVSNGTNWFVI